MAASALAFGKRNRREAGGGGRHAWWFKQRGVRRILLAWVGVMVLSLMAVDAADGLAASVPSTPPGVGGVTSAVRPGVNGSTNLAVSLAGLTMDSLDDKQMLGVGDTVVFRVLEDQEEPRPITVSDTGQLLVPELGLVEAKGKTCRALAAEIKAKLEVTSYYHATVIIGIQVLNKTLSGRRVYVTGEVVRTGPQEIPAGEIWTVSKAIMKAGGFTQYGDKKRVKVVRTTPGRAASETFTINVGEVWEKGRTDLDMSVEPEDTIYVPAKGINFN